MNSTSTENIFEGVEVWVELEKNDDLTFPYKYAKVESIDTSKNLAMVDYQNGSKEKVKLERLTRYINKETINISDMAQASSINKVDLLNNVKNRFDMNMIFTNVGKTLIIVNPYKLLNDVFSVERMDLFIEESKAKTLTGFNKNSKLEPHIYDVAMEAIHELITYREPQAIVISGESGAGKTETAKQAMRFITYFFSKEAASISSSTENSLEVKILACNPVLESFGNSKTVRNDNSSRFGKYIKIFIDIDNKKIAGAYMITYLLEKSRVCRVSKGERNYHIFYQLIKAVDFIIQNNFDYDLIFHGLNINQMMNKNERLKSTIINDFNKDFLINQLGLCDLKNNLKIECTNFNYLNSDVYSMEKVNDARDFFETIEGMVNTGFTSEEITKIIKIASAVLCIGNVDFKSNELDNTKPCEVTEEGEIYLRKVSELLEIQYDMLKLAFTINVRVIRSEMIKTPLKLNDCRTFRDTFAKEIYNRLFAYLVKKMNYSLSNENMKNSNRNIIHIGLLDIFGFENFELNSLEQLCINYSNERLQQLYINDIFKETERLFQAEGLMEFYNKIKFVDNSEILDVVDKYPNGLFFLLDNECNMTADDKGFVSKIFNAFKNHNILKKSRLAAERFIIMHTAKDVDYTAIGFVQKNMDEFKTTMSDCLLSVKDKITNYILNVKDDENRNLNTNQKPEKFLGGKFRVDMNNLIDELKKCICHYIRCLKPNELKRSNYFISTFVMQQIKYLGILDTIRIRKEGYPVRKLYHEFYFRFQDVVEFSNKPNFTDLKDNDPRLQDLSKKITSELTPDYSPNNILFGKTFVFMKQDFFDKLDILRTKLIAEKEKCVTRIAMNFRGKRFRKLFVKLRKLTVRMQRQFRLLKKLNMDLKTRRATWKIQKWWKAKLVRKRIQIQLKKIKKIKIFLRTLKFKFNLIKIKKKIQRIKMVVIHSIIKFKKKKYQQIRNLVYQMCEDAFNTFIKQFYTISVTTIQKHVRGFLFKSRSGAFYQNIKTRLKDIKQFYAVRKIQTYYRMSIMRRYKLKIKFLADKIVGIFRIMKVRTHLKKLRHNTRKIQDCFRTHYYKNKILNDRLNEFNEIEENLFDEALFLNLITLFPNYIYKAKLQGGSTPETKNKLIHRQKFYEKKLLNYQPQLYFQASYLKLSPYEEPKLHFFSHVMDLDIVVNTDEIYQNLWGETLKEVQNFCVSNKSPIISIEVGGMHTTLMNSSGKIYIWGWNGHGQCGFKTNKDKNFKLDLQKYRQFDSNLNINICYQSLNKNRANNFFSNLDAEEIIETKLKDTTFLNEDLNEDVPDSQLNIDKEFKLIKESDSNVKDLINNLSTDFKKSLFWDYYNISRPIVIDNFSGKQIFAGDDFTFLINKDNKLFVFGSNNYFQLGVKDGKNIYDPLNYNEYLKGLNKISNYFQFDVNNLNIVQAVSSGKINMLLTDKGEVIILSHFAIDKSYVKLPKMIQVPDIKFSNIECGKNFCVLLSVSGLVYTFGENDYGQLGLGDYRPRYYPEEVQKFKELGVKGIQICAGYKHIMIRSSVNKVYTWGCNLHGQLGNGTFNNSPLPTLLELSNKDKQISFLQISAGLRSSVILTQDRHIYWCGTGGDIIKQHNLVQFNYKAKIPELFSYDNHQIIKIHHSWSNSMSVMYAVIAETTPLKVKLNNPQKLKFILNTLSSKWINKDIYPPNIDTINNYIASKHVVSSSSTNAKSKKKMI